VLRRYNDAATKYAGARRNFFNPHHDRHQGHERENRSLSGPIDGSELHFRTGIRGGLARFFVARRMAGDSFDATVILPCLIFLLLVRLNDLGRVDAWTVVAGLVIPAGIAGCWIGVSLGGRALGRAMLRAILIGAFEGAASVALVKETVHQSEALINTFNLMYINFVVFFFFAMLASTPSDILTQTEAEWQKVVARQALIHRIIRIALGFEELKGVSTGIGLMVLAVRSLPLLLAIWAAWKFWGISPEAVLRRRLGAQG
jgi:hypothetical protein